MWSIYVLVCHSSMFFDCFYLLLHTHYPVVGSAAGEGHFVVLIQPMSLDIRVGPSQCL